MPCYKPGIFDRLFLHQYENSLIFSKWPFFLFYFKSTNYYASDISHGPNLLGSLSSSENFFHDKFYRQLGLDLLILLTFVNFLFSDLDHQAQTLMAVNLIIEHLCIRILLYFLASSCGGGGGGLINSLEVIVQKQCTDFCVNLY